MDKMYFLVKFYSLFWEIKDQFDKGMDLVFILGRINHKLFSTMYFNNCGL